jgi:hypothetical protein
MVVVTADLFIFGPLGLAMKSTLWYWGGSIAVMSASFPVAIYLNRNPESFGKLIGRWVVFRNILEESLHVAVVSEAVTNWFHYYVLLWWIVAYRFLDVGPRRAFQKLYGTPEKRAARPWAPTLNWAVIASMYFLTAWLIYGQRPKVLYANVPDPAMPDHVSQPWETAFVVGFNLVVVVAFWVMTKRYTQSLLVEAEQGRVQRDVSAAA